MTEMPAEFDSHHENTYNAQFLTEAEAEAMYDWFDKEICPELEGNPGFDDLNDKAQTEYKREWVKTKAADFYKD